MGALGDNLRSIKWDMASLVPIEKNFYQEDAKVTARTEAEVAQFRREKEIQIFGRKYVPSFGEDYRTWLRRILTRFDFRLYSFPKPIINFSEAGFPDYLMSEIKKAGFPNPSVSCSS